MYKKLCSFRTNRSVTPLDLPMALTKEFALELAKPLCIIVNASIQQGKSPSQWKDSFVSPVPKIPTPLALGDLRPITLTQVASLLCESFVAEWMYNDISTKIDLQQYGNVRGSSTTLCLIDFLNFIYEELEKRKTAVTATFIDFKKAFDLVDHNIVIKKAIALGVRECIIPWIADFLSGRRQSVRYLGAMSDFLPTTCGVPQGTILGSLCFLVLINDALLDTSLRWKYVDDCTFAISINTDSPDHAPLQQTLDTLQQWSDSNHMSINPSKTVVLNFSVSITPLPPPFPYPW